MMRLKSLIYTSSARPDIKPTDIRAIHQTARHLNALDGVTGLLIYNEGKFLQIIEGVESAIDDLLQRLLVDPRHSALTIEDKRFIDNRQFPDWAMKLVHVNIDNLETLSATLPVTIRAKVAEMAVTRVDRQ